MRRSTKITLEENEQVSRTVTRYGVEQLDVAYTDESHKQPRKDDSGNGHLTAESEAQHVIIIHAEEGNGFVLNALLKWKYREARGDYKRRINHQSYKKWVRQRLVLNLRPNSVMAACTIKAYTQRDNKLSTRFRLNQQDTRDWLREEGISLALSC